MTVDERTFTTQTPDRPQTIGRRRRRRVRPSRVALHVCLMTGALLSLFPFYWMLVLATNNSAAIFSMPPTMTFGDQLLRNVGHVLQNINFFGSLVNTLIVACSVTALVLFFDSLAAFSFAKYRFPGRGLLFAILIATFLLPAELSTIPQFITMIKLGWVGQLQALIVPGAANAFGIFWMRQYTIGAVPDELIDAARLDGCGFFRQYLHVCLPSVRPALGFLGIFTFIGAWNDYLWPLIVLTDPNKLTLQVALSQLNTAHGQDYGMLMAGALIAVVPLIVVFLFGARQFINDVTKGALRG